jgi:hypothetical protein
MLSFIIFTSVGVALLIGAYHPSLGPRLYQQQWPGYYPKRAIRRKATMRYILLAMCFILIGIVMLLQSFHIDVLTIISVILLGICTVCAIISFALDWTLRK